MISNEERRKIATLLREAASAKSFREWFGECEKESRG